MNTKWLLIVITTLVLGVNNNVFAQTYTINELQEMFDNAQYKMAIPYLKNYVEDGNADAMVLLGDCIRKIAYDNLEKVNKETGVDLMVKNPYEYAVKMANRSPYELQRIQLLQSQALAITTNADLEALPLYTTANSLGNAKASNRLYMLSMQYSFISPPSGNSSGSNTNSSSTYVCPSCKGTGRCGICGGSGTYSMYGYTNACNQCSPTNGRKCSVCKGTGRIGN